MEETGILEQLYVGSPIPELEDYELFIEREIRPGNNLVEGSLLTSLETIKQEMPVLGQLIFAIQRSIWKVKRETMFSNSPIKAIA